MSDKNTNLSQQHPDPTDLLGRLSQLNSIGIALSSEKNTPRLLEMILIGAKSITNADGGTLYTLGEDQKLRFEIIRTKSLGIAMGGTSGNEIKYAPIPLYDDSGKENHHMVVACAALKGEKINIEDAYSEKGFDFSGTREFDKSTGYKSRSFLTIPMKNHENNIIGVLQLINKLDHEGKIARFSAEDEQLAESLASQAAVTLTNKELIDELNRLFESFIKLIATAIDEKSPYTGGHCKRVPKLTMMLAKSASASGQKGLDDFRLTEDLHYELEVAAWLHDCGKITTPEYVIDKATKLETVFDRIALLDARLEIKLRDAEIEYLKNKIQAMQGNGSHELKAIEFQYSTLVDEINENRKFLRKCNTGSEFMSEQDRHRIVELARKFSCCIDGIEEPLLNENEIYNLSIPRGTLTSEEREIVNNHIVATIKMLDALPFPRHLRNVPEFAGGHHERMDGKGYPLGLTREQMSIPARIMAIADIFEALTAKDRPYKEGKKLSEALSILGKMKHDSHIDPDLFDIFIEDKVYLRYAEEYLDEEQIDIDEPAEIPGYPFK